jgi:hypothetical protein
MKMAGHFRKPEVNFPKVPKTDPIPMRPPGYFADVYSKAEIKEDNLLAKASVVRAPKDLE